MTRVVYHHPDGRYVQGDQEDWSDASKNPFNYTSDLVTANPLRPGQMLTLATDPGRPKDDHVSLKDEGFVIIATIAEYDYVNKDGVTIHKGNEVPIDNDLYRGIGVVEANFQTAKGEAATAEHADRRRTLDQHVDSDHPELTYDGAPHV